MAEPAEPRAASREERIAAYKRLLRRYLDRRPSGTRQRIALALGKHKSFVSQITSPTYGVPLPAQHIEPIFELCHFSPEERQAFLAAYRAAHPESGRPADAPAEAAVAAPATRQLSLEIPVFDDPELQREVESTLRLLARRVIALALKK